MVASFDICKVLNLIEAIIFVFYFWIAVFCKRQTKHKIMLLIAVCISFIINVVRLPMVQENWKENIIVILIWFGYAVYLAFWIGKDVATKKHSSPS